MRKTLSICRRRGGLFALGLLAPMLLGAGLKADTRSVRALQIAEADNLSPSSAAELLMMLEQSRHELSELRGQVEELTYELEKMKKKNREVFIDLDKRILELQNQSSQPTGRGSEDSAGDASAGTGEKKIKLRPATAEEKQAYDQAYDLIKKRDYDNAVDSLHEFVKKYPDSDLTPNAYYWLGEVYLVVPRLEQAKQSFIMVVSRYPDHRKAADAFYKLGITYDRLGSREQAKRVFEQTRQRYPNSASAKLASDYLARYERDS